MWPGGRPFEAQTAAHQHTPPPRQSTSVCWKVCLETKCWTMGAYWTSLLLWIGETVWVRWGATVQMQQCTCNGWNLQMINSRKAADKQRTETTNFHSKLDASPATHL